MVRPTNLYQLFVNSAQFYSESAALIYYYENQWVEISYEVLCQKIDYFSGFLSDKGVQKGDRIGLYMENRPEWVIADMAAYRLGAVVVPIYPTLSEQEVAYIVNDSEMKLLILDSQLRFNIAVKLFNCSLLKYIVNVGSIAHDNATYIYSFVDVCAQKLVTQQCDVDLNDLASIVYTSGTTGEQKGVMLTHGNFLANVTDILSVYDLSSADKALSFLPLSHVFERTAGYYTLIAKGVTICYAQSHLTVAQDLQTIKPTVIVSVPRLYEKIYAKIMTQTVGLKKQLLDWAVAVGQNNGIRSWVANQLVFKKILAKTGGKLRFCVSGGAPLAGHLCSFFDAIGLLILEGYGLTETSPVVACNAESDYKTSLNLNPDLFGANYNLGALYFNLGVETNNKANATSNNTVYKTLKKEAENSFKKALPYLEAAYHLDNKDMNTLLSLKQLYYLNGDYKKSEEIKQVIESQND